MYTVTGTTVRTCSIAERRAPRMKIQNDVAGWRAKEHFYEFGKHLHPLLSSSFVKIAHDECEFNSSGEDQPHFTNRICL
jgi:hypothetical protein